MRHLLLALAAVAALVLPACGSGGSVDLGANDVAQAAGATRDARTAKVSLAQKTESGAAGGQSVTINGTGEVDLRSRGVALHADVSGPSALGSGTTIDEILAGTVIYMRSPLFRQVTGSDKWVKLDLKQLGAKVGVDFSQLLSSGSSDPTQSLNYLKATSGKIERIGTEDVRGTSTTHYRAVIDLDRYPDVVPPAQRDAARRNVEQVKKLTGLSKQPEDVWIDSAHRVRKLVIDQHLSPTTGAAAGQQVHSQTTLELYDFGAPVNVTPPPASETTDGSQLLGGAGAP